MSVKRSMPFLLCGFIISLAAMGADETVPDVEFLEYLGMWEDSDEDWLLVDDETMAKNDEQSDPVPESEESAETQDEG